MIFEPVTLQSRSRLLECFMAEGCRSGDFSFGNIYLWDLNKDRSFLRIGDRVILKIHYEGRSLLSFPAGSGELQSAAEALLEACREDPTAELFGLTEEHCARLEEALPGAFRFKETPAYAEYIYSAEKLATYAGKSLHAKKNHCNRFERENDWRFEPLTRENIPECRALLDRWMEENRERLDESVNLEYRTILTAFDAFEALELEGGVLYSADRVVGFCYGEMNSPDTFETHVEKADPNLNGAYPMVCREFARMLLKKYPGLRYIDREEDLGLESLRKSKESYKPEFLLRKHRGTLRREGDPELREWQQSDLEECKELWMQVFGDREIYPQSFLEKLPELGVGAVAREAGALAAAAYVVTDLRYREGDKSLPCGYLYAVATKESFRHHGLGAAVSKRAVELARERGAELIYVLPEEPGLYAWYESILGLKSGVRVETICAPAAEGAAVEALTAEEYFFRREELLAGRPHITPGPAAAAYEALLCRESGGGYYLVGGVPVSACRTEKGAVQLRELLFPAESFASIGGAVALASGAGGAEALVPGESGEAYGAADPRSFAPNFVPYPCLN